MKRKNFWLTVAMYCTANAVLADEAAFRYHRQVIVPPLEQDELVAITLDADIYAATRDGLPDLRLRIGEGQSGPYIVRQAQTTRTRTTRQTWRGQQRSARPLGDEREAEGLEIIVELNKDDPRPSGLSLITRLRNFEQRVRVETSEEGQVWQPTGEESVIFDYSRYIDARNIEIRFPETNRRYFRIVIDDVTAEHESDLLQLTRRLQDGKEVYRDERSRIDRRPFRIEWIEFWRETEQLRADEDVKKVYPVANFQVQEDAEAKQTLITIDTRREPLTSLRLVTPSKNFSRRAVVEAQLREGIRTTWRRTGKHTLSRIDFKNLQREELTVRFVESRNTRYRLVIDNRDSPPLEVTGIEASGNVYQLIFLASPQQTYELAYHSADAEPASYDTVAIQELLRRGFAPTAAELGEPVELASTSGLRWSQLVADPRLLFAVVTVLVLILGWGLYQATKRVDNLPK